MNWLMKIVVGGGMTWVNGKISELDAKAKLTPTVWDDLLVCLLYSVLQFIKMTLPEVLKSLVLKQRIDAAPLVKGGLDAVLEPFEVYLETQAEKTEAIWDDELVENISKVRKDLCESDLLDKIIK